MSISPNFIPSPDLSDPLALWSNLDAGNVKPVKLGLVQPPAGLFENGLSSLTDIVEKRFYITERVDAFGVNSQGSPWYHESGVVKLRTMHVLTEVGELLRDHLLTQMKLGELAMSTKDMEEWRIKKGMRIARKLSLDEFPQLLFNVAGYGEDLFPNVDLMKIALNGSGRPRLPDEIIIKGDNANPDFCKALINLADANNVDSITDMFKILGEGFRASIASTATADGVRVFRDVASNEAWGQGVLDNKDIEQMPPRQRRFVERQILNRTIVHVMRGTDAA